MNDQRLISSFLEAQAAERGAAENTLLAYARDLGAVAEWLASAVAGVSLAPTTTGGRDVLLAWSVVVLLATLLTSDSKGLSRSDF